MSHTLPAKILGSTPPPLPQGDKVSVHVWRFSGILYPFSVDIHAVLLKSLKYVAALEVLWAFLECGSFILSSWQ